MSKSSKMLTKKHLKELMSKVASKSAQRAKESLAIVWYKYMEELVAENPKMSGKQMFSKFHHMLWEISPKKFPRVDTQFPEKKPEGMDEAIQAVKSKIIKKIKKPI